MRAELTTLRTSADAQDAARRWAKRACVRVALRVPGHVGWGEAAPLPGRSTESLDEARAALDSFAWPDEVPMQLEAVETITAAIVPPSARFAAESALLSLGSSIAGEPMWRRLGQATASVPIARVLWDPDPDARIAEVRRGPPAAVYKVKVGMAPLEEEMRGLRALREAIGESELRLDANRSVEAGELDARLRGWAAVGPSFVEEPCALEVLETLARSPVPIALDESLAEAPARALSLPFVDTLVLKPSRLGLIGCLRLARRHPERRAVISHLLDGVVARAAAAHLALVVGDAAAGLGPHPALEGLSGGLAAPWIGPTRITRLETPGLGVTA